MRPLRFRRALLLETPARLNFTASQMRRLDVLFVAAVALAPPATSRRKPRHLLHKYEPSEPIARAHESTAVACAS